MKAKNKTDLDLIISKRKEELRKKKQKNTNFQQQQNSTAANEVNDCAAAGAVFGLNSSGTNTLHQSKINDLVQGCFVDVWIDVSLVFVETFQFLF